MSSFLSGGCTVYIQGDLQMLHKSIFMVMWGKVEDDQRTVHSIPSIQPIFIALQQLKLHYVLGNELTVDQRKKDWKKS